MTNAEMGMNVGFSRSNQRAGEINTVQEGLTCGCRRSTRTTQGRQRHLGLTRLAVAQDQQALCRYTLGQHLAPAGRWRARPRAARAAR